MIDRLEKMLASGQDSAMLRFTLGGAYLKEGRAGEAAGHLREAVHQQPDYSAAWKLLGKALAEAGEREQALDAYEQGIAIARDKGDLQAAKEMEVFRRRLQKQG
ncbi:MAG: tetratricopeptide repeat protein [Ectothiorhodospiraceae bacterium]|nr:tetratricopeptide repeat protein [Ectothiorhodospiraceae bacterium]MCH8504976.1 tetratricopeptide repeat protein [Ectothiorhodospiraceae bacterium]